MTFGRHLLKVESASDVFLSSNN